MLNALQKHCFSKDRGEKLFGHALYLMNTSLAVFKGTSYSIITLNITFPTLGCFSSPF